MTPRPRRLGHILADAPVAASLAARLAQARMVATIIAPVCARIIPGFDPLRAGSCELRDRSLRIRPASGAQSAKLRQAAPRLLASLQSQGLDVIEIRVLVQPTSIPGYAPPEGSKQAVKGAPAAALDPKERSRLLKSSEFSRKLALTLEGTMVGSAAARLARVLDSRLAEMRESQDPKGQHDQEKP